jgi:hypothetical protein
MGREFDAAEFAVLTGIAESALGYDRFNPYHAVTRTPIASQVWRLRRAGYRTICLPPGSIPVRPQPQVECPGISTPALHSRAPAGWDTPLVQGPLSKPVVATLPQR